MLIIFDVDGTLVGGETTDWRCFDEAFHHVAGFPFPENYFSGIPEVTAKAIVHQALPDQSRNTRDQMEDAVRVEFLRRLEQAHAADETTFPPMPGAIAVLEHLDQQDDVHVAIATGDWEDTIAFKLASAGVDVSKYPFASASDCYARADIIRLAAERAGCTLRETVYVGDGLWDYRATQELGIPFLGVGRRCPDFIDAGVTHTMQTLDPSAFADWYRAPKET